MGSMSSFVFGMMSVGVIVCAAPALYSEKEIVTDTKGAFLRGLILACAFLPAGGVYAAALALWGRNAAVLLCALSSFVFSKISEGIILPEEKSLNTAAACAVLVLTQPESDSAAETVIFAVGTALGTIILLTALSPVLRRIKFSDAPHSLKGLPLLLAVLGLCTLAFGGF